MARLPHRRPVLASLVAILTVAACAPSCSNGASGSRASGGRFVDLPDALDMRSVHAAARVSLEAQGYIIESDSVTQTRGEIIARSPVNDAPGFFRPALVVRTNRDIEGPIRLTVAHWPSRTRDHETNTALRSIVDTLGVRPLPTLEERQRAEAPQGQR